MYNNNFLYKNKNNNLLVVLFKKRGFLLIKDSDDRKSDRAISGLQFRSRSRFSVWIAIAKNLPWS
jgi:hypothetical protein